MKNNFYYIILFILLIFFISYIIIKIKEKDIDNWNITKNINNKNIEGFKDLAEDMCNNAKIFFDTNKNLTDNNNIKKTIVNALCNKKNSIEGNNKKKKVYNLMKRKQVELNEILKKNGNLIT